MSEVAPWVVALTGHGPGGWMAGAGAPSYSATNLPRLACCGPGQGGFTSPGPGNPGAGLGQWGPIRSCLPVVLSPGAQWERAEAVGRAAAAVASATFLSEPQCLGPGAMGPVSDMGFS